MKNYFLFHFLIVSVFSFQLIFKNIFGEINKGKLKNMPKMEIENGDDLFEITIKKTGKELTISLFE